MNPNQNTDTRFTDVGGGSLGVAFPPQKAEEKNNFYYDPNDQRNIVEGYLKGSRVVPTQYGEMTVWQLHSVVGSANGPVLGQVMDVIEDSFLEDKLPNIALNSYIRLKYAGRKLKKAAVQQGQTQIYKTNSYHSWDIGLWADAPSYKDMLAKAGLQLPPEKQPAPVQQQQPAYQQPEFTQGQQQNNAPPGHGYQQGYPNNNAPVFVPNNTPPVFNPNQQQSNPGQGQFNPNQGQQQFVPQQQPTQQQPPVQQQTSSLPPAPNFTNPPANTTSTPPVQQQNNVGFGHNGAMPNPQFNGGQEYNQDIKF